MKNYFSLKLSLDFIKFFLWLFAIFFIFTFLTKNKDVIFPLFRNICLNENTFVLIAILIILYAIYLTLFSSAFYILMKHKKIKSGLLEAVIINLKSMLWGNIPGGIWNHIGYFTFSKEAIEKNHQNKNLTITNKEIALLPVQNLIFSVMAISILSLISFIFMIIFDHNSIKVLAPVIKQPWYMYGFLLSLILILAFIITRYKDFLNKKLAFLKKIFVNKTFVIKTVAIYFLALIFFVASFVTIYYLLVGPDKFNISFLPKLYFAYTFSWLVGFLAIPFPGGLGIREWTFSMVFQDELPVAIGFSIMLLHRVFIIFMQISLFVVLMLWLKIRNTYNHHSKK